MKNKNASNFAYIIGNHNLHRFSSIRNHRDTAKETEALANKLKPGKLNFKNAIKLSSKVKDKRSRGEISN